MSSATAVTVLVVFPEGEIYHLNDRLTPLLEGVAAFMALTARAANWRRPNRRDGSGSYRRRSAIAISTTHSKLEAAVVALEDRLFWKPRPGLAAARAHYPDR